MSRFLEALRSGRVLLMDGAMGTELQRAGLKDGECGEHWNVIQTDRIRQIHQAYQRAGAAVFLTNTFQSSPAALERHGLQSQWLAINSWAVTIARSAAGSAGFVLGDIGPPPEAANSSEFNESELIRIMAPFLMADGLLFETCSNLRAFEAAKMIERMERYRRSMPMVISFSFRRVPGEGLVTYDKLTPETCARLAHEKGADALGVNCGRDIGMDEIIGIIRVYRQETDLPLFARPNAGTPTRVGDRWVYPRTPEQMAARLPELLEAGVSMIGGCCGTTPEHIAAFRPIVEKWNVEHASK